MSAREQAGLVAVASHLWSSPVHAAATELFDPQPGESVVDLGAGFGAATLHLAASTGPSRSCRRRRSVPADAVRASALARAVTTTVN